MHCSVSVNITHGAAMEQESSTILIVQEYYLIVTAILFGETEGKASHLFVSI